MTPAPKRSTGERLWRNTLFAASALMAALALLDLDRGRVAGGIGDAGVACLMLSLLPQFPFLQAIVAAGERPREQLLRDLERVRNQNPWADRVGAVGWVLLASSLVLRALGVE